MRRSWTRSRSNPEPRLATCGTVTACPPVRTGVRFDHRRPQSHRDPSPTEWRKDMHPKILSLAVVALLSVSPGSARADTPPDVVVQWNAIMVTTVSGQNPFAQARLAAITQLAVFDAVNAITRDYEPYLDPISAAPGASTDAAAVAAAYSVLSTYVPVALPALDAARASSLAA